MKIESFGENALRVTGGGPELAALVAGARMALRILEDDPSAPAELRATLRRVLDEWDVALARLRRTDEA